MADKATYKIEIDSNYPEFWRYNIAVTCGLFDAENHQTGFVPAESTVAPVGSNLEKCPNGVEKHRRLTFIADDCDHLRMYIYIIPHTLPTDAHIADCKPFPLSVKISFAGKTVVQEKRGINQWSGASIEIVASHNTDK